MEIPARASAQQRWGKKRGEVGAGAVPNTIEDAHWRKVKHSREERGVEVGSGGNAIPNKPLLSLPVSSLPSLELFCTTMLHSCKFIKNTGWKLKLQAQTFCK